MTESHIGCANKGRKVSVRRNPIDEILRGFHNEVITVTIVVRFRNRPLSIMIDLHRLPTVTNLALKMDTLSNPSKYEHIPASQEESLEESQEINSNLGAHLEREVESMVEGE
jgi:hypothetical protein